MNLTNPAARGAHAAYRAGALVLLTASSLLIGCMSRAQPHPPPPAPAVAKAERLPLEDYIPAPGLRWLIHLRPHDLLAIENFREEWSPLIGSERLRAFALTSGINPHHVTEVWIAGYALGTLYIVDGSVVDATAEEAFRSRALSQRDLSSPGKSDVVHLSGMIQNTPQALVRIPHHLIAWAEGDIALARVVRAYAEGKLTRTPSALHGPALEPYRDFETDAPIRGYFIGPFPEATDVVVQSSASGAAATTVQDGRLVVRVQVRGLWPSFDDLSSRLTAWTGSVLRTPAMRALGWGFPLEPVAITCDPPTAEQSDLRLCSATGMWRSAALADALYRLVAAPTDQMLSPAPELENQALPSETESVDTANANP